MDLTVLANEGKASVLEGKGDFHESLEVLRLHADTRGQGEAALDSSSCSGQPREADSSTKLRRASTGSCNCVKAGSSGAVASMPSSRPQRARTLAST